MFSAAAGSILERLLLNIKQVLITLRLQAACSRWSDSFIVLSHLILSAVSNAQSTFPVNSQVSLGSSGCHGWVLLSPSENSLMQLLLGLRKQPQS